MSKKQIESFSAEETERRVKAAVQGAFNTLPKPLKSMTPRRSKAQQKSAPEKLPKWAKRTHKR
jgi:ribosomal protein S10